MKLNPGLIQVYTGSADHTNLAPLGLSLRAAGQGLRTHMTCFLPHEFMKGGQRVSELLKPHLMVRHTGLEKAPGRGKWHGDEIREIKQAFLASAGTLQGGQYDIVVLNDIIGILNQGIVPLDEIMHLMEAKPAHVELVLTGPGAGPEIIERADLVTEVTCRDLPGREKGPDGPTPAAPVEVVTGNGKGKTTSCLGKALLMSCTGARAAVLQFIKSPKAYGEVRALEKIPRLEIRSFGEGFPGKNERTRDEKHLHAARRAWEECLREIFSLKYDLVILDEINIAVDYGFIDAASVRKMLLLKPRNLHLMLSGRRAQKEIMDGATTVTEMTEIKHPFKAGIKARKGIEF